MPEDIAGTGTAVAEGTGAGGSGSTGGDAAGTGVGDTGTTDATAGGEGSEELPAEEIGSITDGGESPAEEPAEHVETPEEALDSIETDGRKVDAKMRGDLAKLAQVDKESAKRLRETYFREQALIKETGSQNMSEALRAVRNLQVTFEALGGEEGINTMQDKVTSYENEIAQFGAGDPELGRQLYESNPEGYAKQVAHGLELLAQKDLAQFDNVLLPSMMSRLDKAGLPQSLERILEHIKEGQGQESYDLLSKVLGWFKERRADANKTVEMRNAKDPKAEEYERKLSEVNAREKTNYENQIGTSVNQLNNRATARVVEPFFKEMKLSNEGRRDFINGMNSKIYKLMEQDKTFQRNAHTLKAKGDAQRTSEYVAAKFAELLPKVFQQHRNANYPNYGAKRPSVVKPTNGTNGKPPAPPMRATPGKVYERSQVDIANTPDVLLITGKAYLKGTQTIVAYNRG